VHNKTPYELLTGNKPNVSYFRVFGCKCFVKNKKERLGKFESRTIKGNFVGYADDSHTYRFYNKSTGNVEVSSNMVFEEFNGSQEEQVVSSDIGDEKSSQVIKYMGLGISYHVKTIQAKTIQMKKIQGQLKWSLAQSKLNHHHHHKWNKTLKRRRKPKNNHQALNLLSKTKERIKDLPLLKIKLKKMVITKTSHNKN
jgi:hypothetical protein